MSGSDDEFIKFKLSDDVMREESKIGIIGHPPVSLIYHKDVESNDEDDKVSHRTEFSAKESDRSDDRCEPYRLQQHAHCMQDTI